MLISVAFFAVLSVACGEYNDYDYDHYSHGHEQRYHGPPAPLKHDGTVDYTPEVKEARAAHFAALEAHRSSFPHSQSFSYHHDDEEELYRRKRSPEHYGSHHGHFKHHEPAPLKHDGTVDDGTAEVKHAKAAFFKALSEAKSHASYYPDEDYHSGHDYSDHSDHSGHYHGKKYHGPPAPLNHDGTVAETPEVKHAKAAHFQLYSQALHRYKRAIPFVPAPLNSDGTVAETPEVQQAKAAFFAAYQAESALADKSWKEPEYQDEPNVRYDQPIHYSFPSKPAYEHNTPSTNHFAPINHFPKHFDSSFNHGGISSDFPTQLFKPSHHFQPSPVSSFPSSDFHSADSYSHKPVIPAPLNHDGTVAETPEIIAAKAVHFAAHQEAFARAVPKKYSHPIY